MGLAAIVFKSVAQLSGSIDLSGLEHDPNTGQFGYTDFEKIRLFPSDLFIECQEDLGNASTVWAVREFLLSLRLKLPILVGQIFHEFAHSGDWITADDVKALNHELEAVRRDGQGRVPPLVDAILCRLERLVNISMQNGNPIVFA